MIICRNPNRLSICGGGSDLPYHINKTGIGMVVGTTIDKYSYFYCRYLPKFFKFKSRFAYSEIEQVNDHKEIQHRVIRAIVNHLDIEDGIEVIHCSDLPSKSGTGSSSSFIVGLLHSLNKLKNWTNLSKEELTQTAIYIEQDVLRDHVGFQDSTFSSYGGLGYIEFRPNRDIRFNKISLSVEDLEFLNQCFMLFYTGGERIASEITKSYGKADQSENYRLANLALERIYKKDFLALGKLLTRNWEIKRNLSDKVSSPQIDNIINRSLEVSYGSKIIGAGAGGCVLCCVSPERRSKLRSALADLVEIPFRFDFTGSTIISS